MVLDPFFDHGIGQIVRFDVRLNIVLVRDWPQLGSANLLQLDDQLLKIELHERSAFVAAFLDRCVPVDQDLHDQLERLGE